MAENYNISLGIDFNDGELKNIKKQLTNLTDNTHRIKIDIDNSRLLKQINHAKKELKELNGAKGNQPSLDINTQSLEKSLSRVADVIDEVRKSLGTLDDKSGMKSLVDSVNQIANALGKVENESDNLVKSLSALSKKDFSINFDLKMGKSASQISSEQGDIKRDAISQLKQQAKALEDYLDQYYKVAQKQEGVVKLTQRTNLFSSFWEMSSNIGNTKNSLKEQVDTYKQYIDLMQEAAKIKGVDLSSVTSGFSKTTNDIVEETKKVSDGAEEVKQALKGIFGGSLDIESLAGQLRPIITDLGEIKTAIQSLSSNNSIDGLTQSFNRLSETLERLTTNLTLAKNTLDAGFSNASTANNAVKTAQQAGQKIGEAVTKSAKQSINLDDVIDEQVSTLMNEYAIAGDKGSNAFKEIRQSLVDFRNGSGDINKVTSAISNNMKVVNEAKNDYKELADYIRMFNASGAKVHIPDSIRQEYGDDYKSMRSQLGKGFTSGQGMDFETFIVELNSILGDTIDLSHGAEAAFGDLVRKVNSTKGSKLLTGDDLFRSGILDMGDVVANVSTSLEQIENAEEQITRASTTAANTVAQNEERKQQAYRETSGVIENLKTTLETMRVDRSSIDTVIKDMEELGFAATDTSVKMKNGGFDITVKGIDSIGRAITEIRHLDSATDEISLVDRKITQSLTETDRFVKQQKQAVSNLTNQINQLNRSAIDQNASRPIKDSAHLDALADKYDEITLAIQRMENASSDTFVDEQNNVKALISDYKSLVSEFKNAENVSSKMKGTDFASGLDIAKNDLEKFKAQAKDFPQIAQTIENLDKAIEGVGDASSLNKFNDQLRVARSELAKIKSETTATNRSEKVGINVSGLESKIADLRKISPEIDRFETEIDGAKVSVQSLLNDLRQVNTQSDFSVVNAKWRAFTDAAKAAGIAVTDTATKARAALANDIKIDIDVGNFDNEMDEMRTKFNSLSDANDKLRHSYEATESAYSAMIKVADANTGDEVADRERLIQAEKEYAAALERTNNLIKKQARADKIDADKIRLEDNRQIFQSKIDTWLTKNSAATKQFGNAMIKLKAQAESCDQVTLNHLEKQFKKLDIVADKAGLKVESLGDRIKSKFKEYSAYLSVAEVFMYISQAMKDMFEQVKLIDSAMTELKKVTNESDAAYNQFLSDASSRAKAIGTTIDGLVSSTADFARLGYGFKESQKLAEVANIYAVVGDEIDGVEGATESLISTMTAFGIEASNSMSIVDKFNIVGNNFAISSGGIGEALERSASSMAAANNSLDETIALITAANTVVQDPASVGQAFKTISMRIRGAKTDLEEAGLDTDGMASSTAKLREEIMALSGVDIMLDNTTFKSTYKIMEELATKWQDLTDIQQASITELIAGKRQGNIVSSLMTNFDIAQNALQTSLDSSGSAMEEHGKYMDSIEAKLSQLKAAWQGFAQTFMNSDFLKGGIDVLKTIIDLLEKLVDNFGLLGTVGLGAGITGIVQYFRFLKNDGAETVKTITDVVNAINNITNAISNVENATETISDVVETTGDVAEAIGDTVEAVGDGAEVIGNTIEATGDVAGAVSNSAKAVGDMVEVAGDGVEAMSDLGSAATKTGGSFKAFMKTPIGVASAIGVAIAAIGLLYNAYKNAKESAAEARQEAIESSDAYLDAASSFERAYIKYSDRTDLTSSEEAELEAAIKGTADALGDKSSALQSAVNSNNDYLASLEAIKNAELEAAKAAAEKKREKAAEELIDAAIGWERWDGSEVNIELNTNETEAINVAKRMGSEFVNSTTVSVARSPRAVEQTSLRLSGEADVEEIIKYYNFLKDYQTELKNAGLENTATYEEVNSAIEKMSDSISVYTDGVYEAVKANYQFKEGIPKTTEEYVAMREAILKDSQLDGFSLDKKMSILNSLDSEYGQLFDLSSAEAQARKFVGIIKGFGDGTVDGTNEIGTVETFLNMRTAVNNNECTVGEYLSKFDEISSMANGFSDEEKEEFKLAFGLDTDSIKEQYESVYNYISRNYIGKLDISGLGGFDSQQYIETERERIQSLLNGLSATELQAVANIKAEIDWGSTDTDKILAQIKEEADLIEALNFEANIEIDTTALELLNTALSESASAMGLSAESIDSLKSRYSTLDSYDPSSLFERTANGVKVNREELEKLEKEYNDLTKTEVQEHLDNLANKYNELTEEIDKCSNAGERAELLAERDTYANKIEELAQYQAQLEGVTGAYQDWVDAQSGPEDYDGYESVATSREDIQDEIDRGFIGNKSKAYIDLLSGEDLDGKSVDDYADAWAKLDDKITGAGYSVNDFFTVNDDGDITATGIDRFFKSLQTDFKDSVAKFDKETGKWTYDFGTENLEKIQKKWGIGIEAIELLLEAAASAGYDIDWDGILDGIDLDTSNFETLVSTAEAAQTAFNKLEGVEDVDFNFTATGVEEATSELEKARSTYIDLITNDDGSINLKADGAAEMRTILSALLIQKQQLEDSNIAINIDTSGLDKSQQDISNAINAVKTFREKYKNLEIAVTTGQGIEEAKTELNTAMTELQGLGDAGVDIAAKLILGEGATAESLSSKVDAAISAVGSKDIKVGCNLDETSLGDLNSQILTNFTPEATVKITGIDDSLVGEYTATEKTANGKVKWNNDTSLVVEFQNKVHEATGKVKWGNNTSNVKTHFNASGTVTWTSGNNVRVTVVQNADGTAHSNGTAFVNGTTSKSGKAFKHGDWGINGSGVSLVGEFGQELVVRDGKYFTVGDKGAEFFQYKPNDIIFNAGQTKQLFEQGKIINGKTRGRTAANGTAFADGNIPSVGRAFWSATATESNFASNRNNVTGGSYGKSSSSSSSDDSSDEFEETIDWIEKAIDRIERAIDQLDTKANSAYRSWSERNKSLIEQISKVQDEIDLQQKAYDKYMAAAEGVGLSSDYAKKVREGKIDIETITDETLKEKIDDYIEWYEKALDCKDAILELKETESELYAQRVENVSSQYEGILSVFEHEKNMLEEYINQSEAQAWVVSEEYYNALAKNERETIAELENQKAAMIAEFNAAMDSGTIAKGSESYYEMAASIDEVSLAITESKTALLEYSQTIQQLKWEQFDLLQDKISSITEETEFLIELMSNDKLFDDNGQLTNEGKSTMGLHGVAYNTYMHQADTAAEEASRLKKELAKDPYDTELEERYREMIALQQEHILAAEGEKEAIRDLVEEGISLELEALEERIDKYNESADAARDLYEYNKKVKEQTKEIASLEKQLSAYSGDDSEEAKQKIQQIKVELEEARADLEETQYDKYIDDSEALLDNLYLEYETTLNTRLDNVDALISDMITEINSDASIIGDTIREVSDSVGYTLTNSMQTIWDENSINTKNVITTYGDKFVTAQTTTNTALNNININLQNMINKLDSIAKTNTKSASTSSVTKPKTTTTTTTTKKSTSSGDGTPKVGDKVKFVSGKYYYDSQGVTPLGSYKLGEYVYITKINKESWATHPYHISTGNKLGKGDLGWLKLNQLSGYATGKKNLSNNEIAWTQENGLEEYIVRPSDGAILTPIARKGSVLSPQASNNLWNMTNSPSEFIKDNLSISSSNVPNNSGVNNSVVQHFENITFSMPNVHGYNELLSEMQRDPKFEKLILSMSINRLAGKSSLAKGKAIR